MQFISPVVLIVVYLLLAAVAAGFSWAMVYHWNRYAFEARGIATAKKIYFAGLVILFVSALAALIIYSVNY